MQAATPSELHALLVFREVVQHGGFAAAARATGMPKPTVSRKIKELEDRLQVRLLNRTTRSISLTTAGAALLEDCTEIAARIDDVFSLADDAQTIVAGTIRLTTTVSLGQHVMTRCLISFMEAYPEVTLQVDLRNERVDLVREGYDVGLRVGSLNDDAYISRTVGRSHTGFYATPRYLENRGHPSHPDDLKDHAIGLVAASRPGEGVNVKLMHDGKESLPELMLQPLITINDPGQVLQAVESDLCLALLPDLMVREQVKSGVLEQVLSPWTGPSQSYCAVYPSRKGLPRRVRVFLDHLSATFE